MTSSSKTRLGRTLASYSSGFVHPVVEATIFQLGKMILQHG
jgi:hypothetical protein